MKVSGFNIVLILTFVIGLLPAKFLLAQSDCPNVDFTNNNFDHWEGYYGHYYNPEENFGFDVKRHKIITNPTRDPNTCSGLITIPTGETISAMLGNASTLSEAEELRYTIPVTPDNDLFIYKYAVVLEDPGHPPEHQPDFTIKVLDQSGQLVDPDCGYYYVFAQPGLPGWHTCNADNIPVIWRNWTTVGLDLSAYHGQTITVVFTTRDCQEGAHFGYAYITAHCMKLQLIAGYCLQKEYVTVTAPPGFTYLWNTGATTQAIVIEEPQAGQIVSCELTAVNGCQVTIQTLIQPTLITPDFSFSTECAGWPVQFVEQSILNQNYIARWEWNYGDGSKVETGTGTPTHIFSNPGTYDVHLKVYSSDSCETDVTKTVTVMTGVSLDIADIQIREGDSVTLDAGNPGAGYLWSTGETTRTITVVGEQKVWVEVYNEYCSITDTINITILPGCPAELPAAFSPNGDGINDLLYVYGNSIESFELQIYDRSGEMVFTTTSADLGWDGTYRGKVLGTGVFNYILRVTCIDGTKEVKKGNVTIIR